MSISKNRRFSVIQYAAEETEPDYRDTWGRDGSLIIRLFSHHMSALVGAAERRGLTPQDIIRLLVDEHLMHNDA